MNNLEKIHHSFANYILDKFKYISSVENDRLCYKYLYNYLVLDICFGPKKYRHKKIILRNNMILYKYDFLSVLSGKSEYLPLKLNDLLHVSFLERTKSKRKRTAKSWRRLRERAINRDKMCVKCGSKKKLTVHHILTGKVSSSLSNLVTLCDFCHKEEHGHYKTKQYDTEVIR